jgi:hypothetical protein
MVASFYLDEAACSGGVLDPADAALVLQEVKVGDGLPHGEHQLVVV